MESKYNWEKISRYVLNESSWEEKKEIEAKIETDNEFAKVVEEMRIVSSTKQKPLQFINIDSEWDKIKYKLSEAPETKEVEKSHQRLDDYKSKNNLRKKMFNGWRYAAVILIMIGVSYFLSEKYYNTEATTIKTIEYKTLSVNKGERKTIVLYDGTTINLDSGSELKYPAKFGSDSREVFLSGEAFFQVAKNPRKPFRIHINDALVEVLGTKFNIRSWKEDNASVVVTVTEGKVSLGLANSKLLEKVILTKNMQSSLSLSGKTSKPIIVDASNYTKWMHNEMYFQDASLKQIIMQLERWYDLHFDVAEELLVKENLTVRINNTNLDDVLELISVVTNTTVERKGNNIRFIR